MQLLGDLLGREAAEIEPKFYLKVVTYAWEAGHKALALSFAEEGIRGMPAQYRLRDVIADNVNLCNSLSKRWHHAQGSRSISHSRYIQSLALKTCTKSCLA